MPFEKEVSWSRRPESHLRLAILSRGHQSPQESTISASGAPQGMFLADLRDQMDLYGLSQVGSSRIALSGQPPTPTQQLLA